VPPPADPALAALDAFYAKPAKALFHALELAAYARAGVRLAAPVLDLGCGDGAAAALLRRCGALDRPPACGLDLDPAALRRARRRGAHRALVRGDAHRLPFADGAFAAVLANEMLAALPVAPGPALAEARRVLAPGGVLVATVPTARQRDHLWQARVAARLPRRAGERLLARFEARSQDRTVLEAAGWLEAFRRAGLEVGAAVPFAAPEAVLTCGLLAVQPLRAFAALRAAPRPGRGLAGRLLEGRFRRLLGADAAAGRDEAGALLVAARRP